MLIKKAQIEFADNVLGIEKHELIKTLEQLGYTVILDPDCSNERLFMIVKDTSSDC